VILVKIIEIVATRCTRCHILELKCTKFDFGWRSAPNPAGGSLQRSPDPLDGFKGPSSNGKDGREGRGRGRREGRGPTSKARGERDKSGREVAP